MLQTLRNSIVIKVLGLILLTLLLCIPLDRIDALNRERGESQREAAAELASTYTGAQTVIGPVLAVPYVERWMETQRNSKGQVTGVEPRSEEGVHLVFPDTLHIEGALAPQQRYRGIFRIPFYTLDATLNGGFAAFDPDTVARSVSGSKLEFRTPYVVFNLSDLRGLDGSPALSIGGATLRFAQRMPGLSEQAFGGGIHAPLEGTALSTWLAGKPLPFDMKLALVGQETLSIVPIANETTAHLQSPWAHPSFGGRFLASERRIDAQGFDARWRVSSLVTSARDQVRAGLLDPAATASSSATSQVDAARPASARRQAMADGPLQTFDVSLAQPLNVYSMSTRAGKYGALFIALVLMAAFMFELFRTLRLHPVQYGLVGLSIALFFLLLLALSEKMAFAAAYASAAAASVLLLGVYFSAVLGGWRRGLSFAAFVAVLYGALYGLLASESNALLLGALLVFGMLALLMLATCRVDWYALSTAGATAPVAEPMPAMVAPTSSNVR
ncbi:cell envelope integrity protein CreD [Variovorax arabinosiphilus]|uniref:cell envelope integrity protein CreD n=1 Tax=Variovorax arabinosiphilus TaxID=3053498 RepID=UPI00257618DC|nr:MULTISPECIES: cell envelope integrity protein CreD [unclassified Variovorax]MDM0121491.1 cell envelope integrity protein CreD [Variovorax sp. J2L1-78]MDM0130552.1 cell envelope integrity protein CreD [Variovorax sp. J2L1-63]MDM0234254.1 cell envelope integrity protein CreD [Variovorax sp. J2R1-6]